MEGDSGGSACQEQMRSFWCLFPEEKLPHSGHPLGYPKHLRQQKKLRNVDSIEARWASRLFSAHLERGAKSALEASSLQLVGAGGSRPLISALAPGSRGRGSSAPGRDPSRSLARQAQAGKG